MEFMKAWKFIRENEDPAIVNLPHDAMLHEKRSYSTPNGDNTGYYPGGKYVYEKAFLFRI